MSGIEARWDDRGDRPLVRVWFPGRSYRRGRTVQIPISVREAEWLIRLVGDRLAERPELVAAAAAADAAAGPDGGQ